MHGRLRAVHVHRRELSSGQAGSGRKDGGREFSESRNTGALDRIHSKKHRLSRREVFIKNTPPQRFSASHSIQHSLVVNILCALLFKHMHIWLEGDSANIV